MLKSLTTLTMCMFLLIVTNACRGYTSKKPPIHLITNMDTQPKYKPYGESSWFINNMTMRSHLENVISRGNLKENTHLFFGKVNGEVCDLFPDSIEINEKLLLRGQERYSISCSQCHGKLGDGKGLVGLRMPIRPSNLYTEYLCDKSNGHIFDVITNGIRLMPAHKIQIEVNDRWAIVAYIRALQLYNNPELYNNSNNNGLPYNFSNFVKNILN